MFTLEKVSKGLTLTKMLFDNNLEQIFSEKNIVYSTKTTFTTL